MKNKITVEFTHKELDAISSILAWEISWRVDEAFHDESYLMKQAFNRGEGKICRALKKHEKEEIC